METIEYPLLSFACEFGDLTAIDCKIAFPHQLLGGLPHDPDRLAADLKTDLKFGKACIAEPGLVIVPRVTPQNMREAAKQLVREGYFASLKPL